jgi:hypothetical protein
MNNNGGMSLISGDYIHPTTAGFAVMAICIETYLT